MRGRGSGWVGTTSDGDAAAWRSPSVSYFPLDRGREAGAHRERLGAHLRIDPLARAAASRNVVTPLASVRALPVTRPARSWKRTSWAWAGASVVSVVKSAMVMIRVGRERSAGGGRWSESHDQLSAPPALRLALSVWNLCG